MRTIDEEIEGVELEILQEYIESGREKELPQDLADYLNLMDVVRGLHMRQKSRAFCVRLLKSDTYGLSDYKARKVYSDAINFFYCDNDIRKEAYRNVYAEKMEKAAALVLEVAKSVKDIEIYVKTLQQVAALRQLDQVDEKELPNELFEKPVKIYEVSPESLGMAPVDRNRLAEMIAKLPITELQKNAIKRDAAIDETILFLEDDVQKED